MLGKMLNLPYSHPHVCLGANNLLILFRWKFVTYLK